MQNPFRYFNSSPEVIRLAVMMYVRYPLSLRQVGDVLIAQGNLAAALKSYQDGLAIRDRLAKADPSNVLWQRDLAVNHSRLAAVFARQGEALDALDALREGRAIIARLKEQSPDDATLPNDLAYFDGEIARLEEADAPELGTAQPEQAAQ